MTLTQNNTMIKNPNSPIDRPAESASEHPTLIRLTRLSNFMDRSITLPGGFKIGWDGIIGLVPGIGDLIGMGVSLYILLGAMRLGASRATLVRMLGNIGVESVVGAIPLIGDIFDLAFRANSRNMRILNTQLENPTITSSHNNRWLIIVVVLFLALVLLLVYLMILLISAVFAAIF